MTRLVRVRQKALPDGIRAFAWPLPNGNVIIYVSTALSRAERARAVRLALRESAQPRHRQIAAAPIALMPALAIHKAQLVTASVSSAIAASATAAIVLALPGVHGPDGIPPLATGPLWSPTPPAIRHHGHGHVPGRPVAPVTPVATGHPGTPGLAPVPAPTPPQRQPYGFASSYCAPSATSA